MDVKILADASAPTSMKAQQQNASTLSIQFLHTSFPLFSLSLSLKKLALAAYWYR